MKRLINLHHWLGTFFCLLFLVWFLSGFVMMYHSFPSLDSQSRIELNANHTFDSTVLSPKEVFYRDGIQEIQSIRINYQLDRPVYHLITNSGELYSKYADNGEVLKIDEQKAINIAQLATGIMDNSEVELISELDQWIPRKKFMPHLPVYKIQFEDNNKTRVYVSSLTGELIQLNTNSERFWAWIGAIPHWIYFRDIRVHSTFWSQLVMCLAGLGLIMAITGIITGIVRYKKKPRAKFKRFKNRWYNFHYYLGLFFGLFVCTWVFSGFMSMTPFDWTPSTALNNEETAVWRGKEFNLNCFNDEIWNDWKNSMKTKEFKEASFSLFQGRLYTQLYTENGQSLICVDSSMTSPVLADYLSVIQSFSIADTIEGGILMKKYDDYYYSRHNNKELPVYKFNSTNGITYYVNPKTTKVVLKCSTRNRVSRWLYNGLHSLDFSFLAWNRPLWDIVMVFLLLGGTLISLTGTGLGVKFIRRKWRKKMKRRKR
ncbi:MAG: PepSY domain-containing protein [Crocinitomicaceae bacterium]|nr:PepSY domain-containing protein [Crocinitomicaceae bacterium]